MEDNNMQRVGMREDNEKKMYESYMSRDRRYSNQRYHHAVRRLGQKSTHNESLQVNPIITDEEPYVTSHPKTTCSAAGSNRSVSIGVDTEDGIGGDCKLEHVYVRPKRRY